MASTIQLDISGMTCNHCVARTQKALEGVSGVESVQVSLEPGGAVVQGSADADALIAAVREAGYEATLKA
ncbi:MAG TPA: heavy metal-binding protein [Sedimenticola thiotaurini]|uniref:Heavy metal-binding protein n=1 Tax=Sedimenticola thiotaurini TaxID=1543721 RepID=A0A831RR36_9GAMM|nr:heavy metal-binding protein [Sedimenticola thiotaurini]